MDRFAAMEHFHRKEEAFVCRLKTAPAKGAYFRAMAALIREHGGTVKITTDMRVAALQHAKAKEAPEFASACQQACMELD